jgi:hypothetical protein
MVAGELVVVEFIAIAPVSGMVTQPSRPAADPHFADIAGIVTSRLLLFKCRATE